ncbi:MAG: hypothetical protein WGN25_09870 [Candidatus Electrothrix sp. GW3-4]|uniref:hypothetical protein n=1 Tax=Candidatus Electrothrix sp. GW3-4 TaxID=3126740 RepID=UPI0030D2547E
MKALTEKIRSIGGRIFTVLRKSGKLTYRQLAKKADTSKSRAFRQVKEIQRRNVYPESVLWEHEEGYEWIRRHFFATLLIFGVQHGIGADTLSLYFKVLRLDTHIGVSPRLYEPDSLSFRMQLSGFKNKLNKIIRMYLKR